MRIVSRTAFTVLALSVLAACGGGGAGGGGGHTAANNDYGINRLSNGGFEIVWTNPPCIASYNRRGELLSTGDRCTDREISRSNQVARSLPR